jgi:hypothetical protein
MPSPRGLGFRSGIEKGKFIFSFFIVAIQFADLKNMNQGRHGRTRTVVKGVADPNLASLARGFKENSSVHYEQELPIHSINYLLFRQIPFEILCSVPLFLAR